MAAGGRRTCQGHRARDEVRVASGADQHLPKPCPLVAPPHQPGLCLGFLS